MIRREHFMDQILAYIDKPLVKVITGIRRCGKSAMLALLREELMRRGIGEDRIIHLNFESMELADVSDAERLYQHIKARMTGRQRYYLLLDEIQEVEAWEKAVNSLAAGFNTDITITGSNSRLLSSELATYLAGRYVELHLYTLSFAEYLLFKEARTGKATGDKRREFEGYLRGGGFPVVSLAEYTDDTAMKVVFDIYSSIILRDTIQRNNIRDVELLERVVRFIFDNTGNRFSANNVAEYFKSQQRKIDLNTVYNYLNALEGAYIIHRVPRYDIRGKEILKTMEKYYPGDHSLVAAVMGQQGKHLPGQLENIVMLELKRRGYRVFTGRSEDKEIDFIAEKKDRRIYVQVAYRMDAPSTVDREFGPLLAIRDHYPKVVVTMDETWDDVIEGVRRLHIADFLTGNT